MAMLETPILWKHHKREMPRTDTTYTETIVEGRRKKQEKLEKPVPNLKEYFIPERSQRYEWSFQLTDGETHCSFRTLESSK